MSRDYSSLLPTRMCTSCLLIIIKPARKSQLAYCIQMGLIPSLHSLAMRMGLCWREAQLPQ